GFRTGVLTNSWVDDTAGRAPTAALLQRLRPHFDLVLESCRIGIRKPDPGIYSRALEELRARPEEV
ncbi:HYES hydrolase, partial [Polioptila caerulea]|nr:HYES hydrolase [Polioptila caerulea]